MAKGDAALFCSDAASSSGTLAGRVVAWLAEQYSDRATIRTNSDDIATIRINSPSRICKTCSGPISMRVRTHAELLNNCSSQVRRL